MSALLALPTNEKLGTKVGVWIATEKALAGLSATRKLSPERTLVAAIGVVEGVNRYYR
jgi:hypothetical protein